MPSKKTLTDATQVALMDTPAFKNLMKNGKAKLVGLILEEVEQHSELQDAYKDLKEVITACKTHRDEVLAKNRSIFKVGEELIVERDRAREARDIVSAEMDELQEMYNRSVTDRNNLHEALQNRDITVDELIADKVALQKSLEELEKQLQDEKAEKCTYKAEQEDTLNLLVAVEAECEEHKRTICNLGQMHIRIASGYSFEKTD